MPCILVALAVATVSVGALTKSRAASSVVVHQRDRAFMPEKLKVSRNSEVRFVNDEAVVHHAFVDSASFKVDSGDIAPGEAATLLFDKEGRFLVRCAIHPRMRMEVDVTP